MAKVWMINKIWYWSVPDQHVLPRGEVYKGIDCPRLIQASKSPCLKVYHEMNQAGNTKSTSLSASRKDFISTWPPCLWTSANSLLEALCTILPLPSTLHLCSLIFRRLYQKYSGEKKRDTFFQQHQLLPTRDHVHQIPSPGMLALFKKSFTKIILQ